MKSGDKIICIDNEGIAPGRLTVGKVYEVKDPPQYNLSDTAYVINDEGNLAGYYKKRFRLEVV